MKEEKVIPCEVYSRVVGYFRPVQNWNDGKKMEFVERKMVKIKKDCIITEGEERKAKDKAKG